MSASLSGSSSPSPNGSFPAGVLGGRGAAVGTAPGVPSGSSVAKPATPTTSTMSTASGALPSLATLGSRAPPVATAASPSLGTPVMGSVGVLSASSTSGLNPYLNKMAPPSATPYGPAGAARMYGAAAPPSMSGYPDVYQDPSNVFPATPYTPTGDLFMSPQLRQKFQHPPASTTRNTTVASSKFNHYTAIVNVDTKATESTLHRSLCTQVLRTTNRYNGKHVILRRLVNAPATATDCAAICDRLRHFRHPNLVPLHSITPTNEFVLGSNDIIVEYRVIKRARSFQECFMSGHSKALMASLAASPTASGGGSALPGSATALHQPTVSPIEASNIPCELTEGVLWSIACQLVSLIRTFHDVQTPLRGLHLSKLMWLEVVGRVYFTGLGLIDLADPNTLVPVDVLMKQDIVQLGLVLLQLVLQSPSVTAAEGRGILQRGHSRFSSSMASLIVVCLEGSVDIITLCRGLGDRLAMEIGHQQGHADFLLAECGKEVHNGRLMRLMVKLSFVLESLQGTEEYAESADRCTLRLFSQYVFNQADEHNRPRVDWGHVFHALNKLDCGSEDLVQLFSQDSTTILVVSYRDIRTILDKCFEQLQAPGQELSFAGLSALQLQPTSTPPTLNNNQ